MLLASGAIYGTVPTMAVISAGGASGSFCGLTMAIAGASVSGVSTAAAGPEDGGGRGATEPLPSAAAAGAAEGGPPIPVRPPRELPPPMPVRPEQDWPLSRVSSGGRRGWGERAWTPSAPMMSLSEARRDRPGEGDERCDRPGEGDASCWKAGLIEGSSLGSASLLHLLEMRSVMLARRGARCSPCPTSAK